MSNCNIILVSGEWENYHLKGFYTSLKRENPESDIAFTQYPVSVIINLISCILKLFSLIKSFGKLIQSNYGIKKYCPWVFIQSTFLINNVLFHAIDTALISSQINKIIGNYSKDYKILYGIISQSIIF